MRKFKLTGVRIFVFCVGIFTVAGENLGQADTTPQSTPACGALTAVPVPCMALSKNGATKTVLSACRDVIYQMTHDDTKAPEAGKKGDGAGGRSFLVRNAKFLYNYGEDTNGNSKIFPAGSADDEGFAVDLSQGEGQKPQPFGKPCSRCVTDFNQQTREIAQDYKGRSCGSETTVRVTLGGSYVNFGSNAFAWYRGLFTLVLSQTMNNVYNGIQSSSPPLIPVSPGCQALACTLKNLEFQISEIEKGLEKSVGKNVALEVMKDFKDWDKTISTHPDRGKLRQLAQNLRTLVDSTEVTASYLTACTISDQSGKLFREKVGNWEEFMNPTVVAQLNARVRAKTRAACRSVCETKHVWKHIGRCISCLNSAANAYTPPEVAQLFQNKCEELEQTL